MMNGLLWGEEASHSILFIALTETTKTAKNRHARSTDCAIDWTGFAVEVGKSDRSALSG